MQTPKRNYDRLEFHEGKEIPYLRGTRIRSDDLYCLDHKCWQQEPKSIAKHRDLSMEDVQQALAWCTENDDLVTRVLTQERKEAGVKD